MKCIRKHVLLEGTGTSWNDFPEYLEMTQCGLQLVSPQKIHMWTGQFLDKLQVFYENKTMEQHGGHEPGETSFVDLDKNEVIEKVELNYMPWGQSKYMIRDLIFHTNKKRELGFHAWSNISTGMKHCEFAFPNGSALLALGGKTDYYNPKQPWCISGLDLYYAVDVEKRIVNEKYEIVTLNGMDSLAWHAVIPDRTHIDIKLVDDRGKILFDSQDITYMQKKYTDETYVTDISGRRVFILAGADAPIHLKSVGNPIDIDGDTLAVNNTFVISSGENMRYDEACLFIQGWKKPIK